MDRKYVVVDLEATGPHYEAGDAIIQIGLTILEQRQISQTLTIDINPERMIPPHITELTGISNEAVAQAPLFEEVADYVMWLLEDAVFVAHQAAFDFNMLSYFLKKSGYDAFHPQIVDTLTLAKILWPCDSSYRLSALSQQHGVVHTQAHHAGSDAQATAQLLLQLFETAVSLPVPTLNQLHSLDESSGLSLAFFWNAVLLEKTRTPHSEQHPCRIVHGLACLPQPQTNTLKPPAPDLSEQDFELRQPHHPAIEQALAQFFGDSTGMQQILDTVPQFDWAHAVLPFCLAEATKERPIVVSVATVHQHQEIQATLAYTQKVATLYSRYQYVSLQNVHYLVQNGASELTLMEQQRLMSVLVWLTATETGLRQELNPQLVPDSLWDKLSKPILQPVQRSSLDFSEIDFYMRAQKQKHETTVYVTTHAYLARHLSELATDHPALQNGSATLVVSDLEQMQQQVAAHTSETCDLYRLSQRLQHITSWSAATLPSEDATVYIAGFQKVSASIQQFVQWCAATYPERWEKIQQLKQKERCEIFLTSRNQFATFQLIQLRNQLEHAVALYEQLQQFSEVLIDNWRSVLRQDKQFLKRQSNALQRMIQNNEVHTIIGLRAHQDASLELALRQQVYIAKDWVAQVLVPLFARQLYLGCGMQYEQAYYAVTTGLGLTHVACRTILPKPYPKRRVLVVQDFGSIVSQKERRTAIRLAQFITQLMATKQKVAVLCTAYRMIEQVQRLLANQLPDELVLAQQQAREAVSLARRFAQAPTAVLLATSPFWEDNTLSLGRCDVLIVVRLPFASPDSLHMQAHAQFQVYRDAFYEETLPLMVRQLNHQLARITEKELLVVLDDRLCHARYRRHIIDNLLPGTQVVPINLKDVTQLGLNG